MGYILFDKETTLEELEENYQFMSKYNFAVTKGIFSEMFSAEGTKLNDKLRSNDELIESDFINNNNKYSINDEQVNKVYGALKRWHKSHCEIYDMTIDPLTAPKAISEESRNEFYDLAMELKKKDLEVFRDVLMLIRTDPNVNLQRYVEDTIIDTSSDYEEIAIGVKRLYKKNNLNYNAKANPFI